MPGVVEQTSFILVEKLEKMETAANGGKKRSSGKSSMQK